MQWIHKNDNDVFTQVVRRPAVLPIPIVRLSVVSGVGRAVARAGRPRTGVVDVFTADSQRASRLDIGSADGTLQCHR